jgi:hypothetical protein
MENKDHGCHEVPIFFFHAKHNSYEWGRHVTLQASNDGNNSSTFFCSCLFYMSAFIYVLSTTLDTTFVYLSLE